MTIESVSTDRVYPLDGIYVVEDEPGWWLSMVAHRHQARPVQLTWLWPHQWWVEDERPFEAFLTEHFEGAEQAEQAELYLGTLRILAHLCLYLSSPEPDTTPIEDRRRRKLRRDAQRFAQRARGRRARTELECFTRAQITRVGSTLSSSEDEPGEREGPQKHWVRGHWNYDWVGPKGEQHREPRWIQPHRRGTPGAPDKGGSDALSPRVYRVDEESNT